MTGSVLTVGADETATSLTVTATSTDDGTKSGTATVSIYAIASVGITPSGNAEATKGKTLQLSANVTHENAPSALRGVVWTIEGNEDAGTAISDAGLLTVAEGETASTLTIKATAVGDAAVFDTVVVTLTGRMPVSNDDVKLHYIFDGDAETGGALKDYSADGNDTVITGSISDSSWTADGFAFASGNHLKLDSSVSLVNPEMTIVFKIKRTGNMGTASLFWGKNQSDYAGNGLWINTSDGLFISHDGFENNLVLGLVTNDVFPLDEWVEIAYSIDTTDSPAKGILMINGVKQNVAIPEGAKLTPPSAPYNTFGMAGYDNEPLTNATMGKLLVLDRALTESELLAIYNDEFPAYGGEKSDLELLYDEYKDLTQGAYTDASWAKFEAAMEYAEEIIADSEALPLDMELAAAWIEEAYDGLKLRTAFRYLNSQIARGEVIAQDNPAKYSVADWNAFIEALEEAVDIADDPASYTDDEAFAAALALLSTIHALNTTTSLADELLAWVNIAKVMLDSPDAHIPAAVANLQDAVDDAEELLEDAGATDAALQAMIDRLLEAIAQYYEKGDKTALQTLYDIFSAYDEADYTSSSWAPFEDALEDALAVLQNDNAVDKDVAAALDALIDAEEGLAFRANFTSLIAAITQAQSIIANRNDYIASTLIGLPALIAAGQGVASNADATQASIDAARNALREAIAKARIKPDRSPLIAALNAMGPLNLSLYTDGSVQLLNTLANQATELLARPDEEVMQDQINALTEEILKAIAGLTAKPAGGANAPQGGNANAIGSGGNNAGGIAPVAGTGGIVLPGTDGNAEDAFAGNVPATAGDGLAGGSASDSLAGSGTDVIEDGIVPQASGNAADDSASPLGYVIGLAALLAVCLIAWIIFAKRRKEKEDSAV
jgi:hypothetical protein